MNVWALLMIVAAGLFAGGALSFVWSRVPIWRTMPVDQYVDDFGQTIDRTDKVQPAFLVVAVIAALVFAFMETGLRQILALVGAAGFVLVLVLSFAIMVPLQRRIVAEGRTLGSELDDMRARWYQGNFGRSVVSVLAFVAMVGAALLPR